MKLEFKRLKKFLHNFTFQLRRQKLVKIELLNHHIEVIQECIFKIFSNCQQMSWFQALGLVAPFYFNNPRFELPKLFSYKLIIAEAAADQLTNQKRKYPKNQES